MPLAPGVRLGHYEILSTLGAGGMGEVYRAHDPRLGRDVAIKSLPSELATEPERLSRFRREAQTLAALNHSNIAVIYGLEESAGVPYLVLELIEGETLATRLSLGPLPAREALALGIQIASAIEAAHERGIVHRDLKPGNVMITRTGNAKVVDFGLARSEPPLLPNDSSVAVTVTAQAGATMVGMVVGTAAYMSPEQARGKPVDRRSDLWSFGCVLYECVAGRRAFAGETASDLIAKILEREPDWSALPETTPARLREILKRCLRKDADARPRDIRDVRLELSEIAAGGKSERSSEKSVAVLPFENLSGADDEYFADGITDEILNALAHLDGLRVAARASCFAFKGRRADLRAIGEKLDVGTVLEGTVRRSGSRLRITVQLANAADGYQLWSERYDREMTDVFAVQDEIAGAIAARLRGTMHGDGRRARHTQNLEAYELLLKGRALQKKRGRFLPEAVTCFERAIALDSNYAEAMAELSESYRLMGVFGTAPFSYAMPKAKAIAEQALAIDPTLAEAWVTIAGVYQHFDWDFKQALAAWDRALTIDPRHSQARLQRVMECLCQDVFDVEKTVAEVRRAVEDDPLNPWVGGMQSHVLGMAGLHAESIDAAERGFALDADSFFAHWNVVRGHAWAGHYERAIELSPSLLMGSGRHQWALGALGWSYGKAGDVERARAVYGELEARSRHEFIGPFWLVTVAGAAGLTDEMVRNVRRAVAEREPILVWSRRSPFWEAVREHPCFEEVIRAVWR
jgi:serine/threonine-protein kinase